MSVTKILAVVPVADLDASVAWYERLLGRAADARPMPGLADWHLTDTAWVQVFRDPDRAGGTALNFAVDDLAAHTAELAGRGIALGEVTSTDKNAELASATDPDGNTITFIQNPST
ncbi:VOC family protein [Actinophytocola sp.]|uniref:VOC family protein n=1 Tax=Actinophytocola sp. TaxID=1872138 RepID=UPI002D809344|nr:VOC family protein [Actinophytocola sp.]HET9143236.1 VOC family protein [Actinophytocola sp.]HEU5107636.1 VOC family protein [Micromonosporaceae bacterium]